MGVRRAANRESFRIELTHNNLITESIETVFDRSVAIASGCCPELFSTPGPSVSDFGSTLPVVDGVGMEVVGIGDALFAHGDPGEDLPCAAVGD